MRKLRFCVLSDNDVEHLARCVASSARRWKMVHEPPGAFAQAPLIGVGGTPDSCAFEMREMKRNYSGVPVGRGDIGRETFDAARAADRGRLRFGSCGATPRFRVASAACDRRSARAAPTVAVARLE